MIIYNSFAALRVNSLDNIDQLLPVTHGTVVAVTENEDETDSYITVRLQRLYNADGELFEITRYSVVNPVVISSVTGVFKLNTVAAITVGGTGFGSAAADMKVFIEYHPDWWGAKGPNTRYQGTISSWSTTSMVVSFNLIKLFPRMFRGAAKLIVMDSNRGLEESYNITITADTVPIGQTDGTSIVPPRYSGQPYTSI